MKQKSKKISTFKRCTQMNASEATIRGQESGRKRDVPMDENEEMGQTPKKFRGLNYMADDIDFSME
uniref:Uncharacterized protein n=1 Tax=Arundo donax TaxID=35708 RepID=A0A0A9BMN0_ARUDO